MKRCFAIFLVFVLLMLCGCAVTDEPEPESSGDAPADSSMMQQFTGSVEYDGRRYIRYETYADGEDLIGEYVEGSSVSESEYGTYAVDGYDTSFMLCTRYQNGNVAVYICKDGLNLASGGDLFDALLHLPDGYDAVQYQSHEAWFWGSEEYKQANEEYAHIVRDFIGALCTAEPILVETLFPEGSENSIYDTETGHLYFRMGNGMTVHIRLFGGHLVGFEGTMNYCFRVDEEAFDALIELFGDINAITKVEHDDGSMTYEDCLADPDLGGYLPENIPNGMGFDMAYIVYDVDGATGELLGSKEIYAEFNDPAAPYDYRCAITVAWADMYVHNGWAGPMIDASELSPDTVAPYVKTTRANGEPLDRSDTAFGIWVDDVLVVLSATGLDVQTAYEIMASVSG